MTVTRLPDGSGRHAPECECVRCSGFAPGNGVALIHGANASVAKLLPEAEPLAEQLAPLVPAFTESDRPLVLLLALTFRRIARAEAYLSASEEASDADRAEKLARELRGWVNSSVRIMDSLGMSPTARARLGLDLARGASELERYVEHAYGESPASEATSTSDAEEAEA